MCHVDTFTSNFYPSRQSPDRAPPVGVFDIPKAEPSRRGRSAIGRLRGTHDAANGWWTRRKRGGGLAWFNALERSGRPRPQRRRLPPRVYASTAVASPRSMGCPGVRLQRLRGRGAARRRCYSTPSPPRVASGRRAAPSVSSRSLSRRARRSCARLSKRRLCRCASPWLPRVDFDEGQPDQALRWAKYITGPVRELGLGACRLYAALCQLSPDSALSECGAEGA